MINGLAPVLIFEFPWDPTKESSLFNAISGVPIIGEEQKITSFGIPLPIYLSRGLTGVVLDNDVNTLDIDTEQTQKQNNGKIETRQRGINNSTTLTIEGRKNSIALMVLLSLKDEIFRRLVSGDYRVSYYNGPTVVTRGLLQSFSSVPGIDEDLIRITMQLQRTDEREIVTQNPTLTSTVGAIPQGVVS